MLILDQLEKNGIAVEINTSGFYREINEQYPNERIIKELIQRKIPITLGSDAHRPQNVGYGFDEIIAKLKKWGLTKLCQFSNQEVNLVPLD